MGNSPAIYGGSRTKILTSKGLLLKDGTTIDFNGQKNYITKGSFPTNNTLGWNLKRTTLSGLIPNQVSASWTTPSVLTLSATTTGALTNSGYTLSLAASAATTAGDMLVSDAYTLDVEDQAKPLRFQFSYKAYANSSNLNFSGTSSNTFHVYIYDETNSAWIQPSGCYTMVQGSGVGTGYGEFQTPINMSSFRIAIVSANASAGAFTLYFDNFYVGPQFISMGPPVTDWVSYTPTITAGQGTIVATLSGKWRRIGDSAQITLDYVYSSGTGTAVDFRFNMPSGLTIDTGKLTGNAPVLGNGYYYSASTGFKGTEIRVASATTIQFTKDSITGFIQGTDASVTSAGISAIFSVPITGWSSNTVMSSDAATNVVAASYGNASNTTTIGTSGTGLSYDSKTFDTTASFNNTTYTVPVAGQYKINHSVIYNVTAYTATGNIDTQIYVDATVVSFSRSSNITATGFYSGNCNYLATLKAGQTITFGAQKQGGTFTANQHNDATGSRISIERISGPAQISASSVVSFRAYKSANQTGVNPNNSLVKITWGAITTDSNSSFDTTNSRFVAPMSGYYQFSVAVSIAGTNVLSTGYAIDLYKNGNNVEPIIWEQGTVGAYFRLSGSSSNLFLNAGDYIEMFLFSQGNHSVNTLTIESPSWFSGNRIGGVM